MVTDCSINCKALFPMQASSLHRAPQAEGSSGAALRAGHRGTHFYQMLESHSERQNFLTDLNT